MIQRALVLLAATCLAAACSKQPATAPVSDLTLDAAQSRIGFVSVKNGAVAELHHFTSVAGAVTGDGTVTVSIPLSSVETNIPIRNERMQKLLFDVDTHPTATVTATLPPGTLASLRERPVQHMQLPATLSLHGAETEVELDLLASRTHDGQVLVSTRQPVMLQATDFALTDGINALREVAGLDSIAAMVPVTATLHFVPK